MGKRRRKVPRERRTPPDTSAMARDLVRRGLSSPRILDPRRPKPDEK